MHFNLSTIKGLLAKIPPVVAALPEFKEVFDTMVSTFTSTDEAQLRQTYAELIAENDAGFKATDAALEEAKKR